LVRELGAAVGKTGARPSVDRLDGEKGVAAGYDVPRDSAGIAFEQFFDLTLGAFDVPDAVGFAPAFASNGDDVLAPEMPKATTVNLKVPEVLTVIVFENVDDAMAVHSSTSA